MFVHVSGLVDFNLLHRNVNPVAFAHQLQLTLQPAADGNIILAHAEAPDVQAYPALLDPVDINIVRSADTRVNCAQRFMNSRELPLQDFFHAPDRFVQVDAEQRFDAGRLVGRP